MPAELSSYEIRPASSGSGARVVERRRGETVVFNGRALDGISLKAAREIVALLERVDILRDERHSRILAGSDLAAIVELRRDPSAGPGHRR
jgi:hypothetical protein